jgi:glycosyltransferase involved in cell wall biosynthesis
MRLGVYTDTRYRSDGERLWTHQAFVSFATHLPAPVTELVLFGRVDPAPGRSHYPVPSHVRFVPLPHYPRVTSIAGQLRAVRGTRAVFARELRRLDAVWIFGPHPIALALALVARARRTPVFLGVRQDYPTYIARRLPSRAWGWAVPVAHALERSFRLLARTSPTVAVGNELARHYAGGAPVLATGFSLVSESDIVDPQSVRERFTGPQWRILSVGRLDSEKNPLLLVDVLAALQTQDSRWRLTVAGEGPLEADLRARAREAGVGAAIDLVGYVAQGEALRTLYRSHDGFLHVSLTEGFPQVIFEAQAAGTPVVATAVGGVPAAVEQTQSALLVPPADAAAAAAALTRVAREPELRRRLVARGLENVRAETMEAQLARIATFFASALERGGRGG